MNSVCEYVVDAVKVLKEKKIKYQLTSMGTIMESDSITQLFDLAGQMHKADLAHVDRVITFIELEESKDKKIRRSRN